MMAYGFRPGFGVYNVTSPQGVTYDCDSWSNLFVPTCWGILNPSAAAAASNVLANPQTIEPIQAPPTVGAPAPTASNPTPMTTPPASTADAQSTVDATLQANYNAWLAQNQATVSQTAANLAAAASCTETILPSWGICDSTVYWGAAIVGVFGLVLFMGRR